MPDVKQTLMGLSILATGYQGFPEAEKVLWDAIELLRRQEEIIEHYHKADTFLEVHGWRWEDE